MNNLRYTYAIQLLEEELHLLDWQKGALPWKFIGQCGIDEYYLVALNVGKWENISPKLMSSKIQTDVPIMPRGGFVWRVSDVEEKSGRLTNDIKLASIQNLYLRFVLGIGDGGTVNILIREDSDRSGRLISGIDLEDRDKRIFKEEDSRLVLLFCRLYNKHVTLYESYIHKIKLLSYGQLNQHTIDRLLAVGIKLDRLKVNMARWSQLD
jgi:hypothetical protein